MIKYSLQRGTYFSSSTIKTKIFIKVFIGTFEIAGFERLLKKCRGVCSYLGNAHLKTSTTLYVYKLIRKIGVGDVQFS